MYRESAGPAGTHGAAERWLSRWLRLRRGALRGRAGLPSNNDNKDDNNNNNNNNISNDDTRNNNNNNNSNNDRGLPVRLPPALAPRAAPRRQRRLAEWYLSYTHELITSYLSYAHSEIIT